MRCQRIARARALLLLLGLLHGLCPAVLLAAPRSSPAASTSQVPRPQLGRSARPAPAALQAFVRVQSGPQRALQSLQTSISRLQLPGGQSVDLVAAVHMADPAYYKQLQQRFSTYEAVLYELIVDTGSAPAPRGGVVLRQESDHEGTALSMVQLRLCRMLGLSFQLASIDYGAPNFVHADMTLGELRQAALRRGETPTALLKKVFEAVLSHQEEMDAIELSPWDLLRLLTAEPSAAEQRRLRRVFARSFTHMEIVLSELEGTTLLAGRNQRALQVLDREVVSGRKRLALFYGAAHLPHLERHLLTHGARLVGREWLDAWDLR